MPDHEESLWLIVLALFVCTIGFSQTTSGKNPNAPRKGYYAIGNNAAKYSQGTLVVTNGGSNVTKGYYAQKKYQQPVQVSKSNQQFVVTNKLAIHSKGYYVLRQFQATLDTAKSRPAAVADSTANP